ncbi:MAG: hypothetical protein AAGJ50_10660 [Pseudomonadota bacterium]
MIRLISALLLIIGIFAAAYGGVQLYKPGSLEGEEPPLRLSVPVPVQPEQERPSAPISSAEPSPEIAPSIVGAPPRSSSARSSGARPLQDGIAAPEPNFGASSARVAAQEPSLMDRLETVPIAYETPPLASFGRAFDVTLSIDGTGDTSAISGLPGVGQVTEAEARVSDRVKATLIGSAFTIEGQSPETQLLSPETENVWRWRATPNEGGEHPLIIEIFALDGDEALPVRTFSDTVVVEVSRLDQAITLANAANPIVMVLGGIGSALAGLFGVVRFFKPG